MALWFIPLLEYTLLSIFFDWVLGLCMNVSDGSLGRDKIILIFSKTPAQSIEEGKPVFESRKVSLALYVYITYNLNSILYTERRI